MQTILGGNGQIGHELAKELARNYTENIRLVSRHPRQINPNDELVAADLLKIDEAKRAIAGSDIVYFTVGLPNDGDMWVRQFPIILANVINACETYNTKLVFFDNTYMYTKNAEPQIETSAFLPKGQKSVLRAKTAKMVLQAIASRKLTAVICRAPEFYGPADTKSVTNMLVFDNIRKGKRAMIPISNRTKRSLIWTPDASRAMALIGNTSDAYGQTWHLPTAGQITYQEMLSLIQNITGKNIKATIVKNWMFKLMQPFSQNVRELQELLPRYEQDNLFVTDKFQQRFPDFQVTTFEQGCREILNQ